MGKRVFLALLPPWSNNMISLGIPCITPNLINSGHEVIQKDYNIDIYSEIIQGRENIFFNYPIITNKDRYKNSVYPLLREYLMKWTDEIIESNADIVGFTSYDTNLYTILELSRMIKDRSPDKIIVVGGFQTSKTREYLDWDCVDFAVIGDGETSFSGLVNAIDNPGSDIRKIKGLIYNDKVTHEVVFTGINKEKMDDLPIPDFKDYDFKKYNWGEVVPIEGSRGCINNCAFCNVGHDKDRYRVKSGEKLFNEFKHFASLGHSHFFFGDSLVNGNLKELEKFCDLVIESGINQYGQLYWEAHATIREGMTVELLHKMKKSGCNMLEIGLESASNNVQKKMKKNITTSLASEVIKNMHSAGILVLIFIIIGFPTETEDDFNETMDFVEKNKDYIFKLCFGKNGCVLNIESDLLNNPDTYGIYWNSGETNKRDNWYSKETTPAIRSERGSKLVQHCESLKVGFVTW